MGEPPLRSLHLAGRCDLDLLVQGRCGQSAAGKRPPRRGCWVRARPARAWSSIIADETDKDVETIVLAGESVSREIARQSARIIAQTLVGYRARALENHALGEIQNWRDDDEGKVKLLRDLLHSGDDLPR